MDADAMTPDPCSNPQAGDTVYLRRVTKRDGDRVSWVFGSDPTERTGSLAAWVRWAKGKRFTLGTGVPVGPGMSMFTAASCGEGSVTA
jgi:hypothetical protein